MTCFHVWCGFDGRHCGECAPKPVTPRKTLRQVMQSGDPYWPGGEVEQKAWFAGYDAAAAEAHGLLRRAASLVYRIEAAGPIDDERTNFERWKADARALAPELRASLATQPLTLQEGERLMLRERIDTVLHLSEAKPLTGELSDIALTLLREAAAQLAVPSAATSQEGEAVAWCSPGQLANLMDVDRDGGVYLPIRKTKRGNFTMPLFAATPTPPTLSEDLRALSERATPGPWAWEQCGEMEDVPVIGIAFPGDDPDCKTPYEGEFRDSDANRMTIAYDWQTCDGHPPSANAAFAVAAVNHVRAALAQVKAS